MRKAAHALKGLLKRNWQVLLLFVLAVAWTTEAWSRSGLFEIDLTRFGFSVSFSAAPLLLLSGLAGYVWGLAAFLILFVTFLLIQPAMAFVTVVALAGVLCFSLFSQTGWFGKWYKALLAVILTSMASAGAYYVALEMVNAYQFGAINTERFLKYFLGEFFECFAVGIILYLFFRFASDRVKRVFPLGRAYLSSDKKRDRKGKARLSVKLTSIIVFEAALLGVSAIFFANVLFPDLQRMLTSQFDSDAVRAEVDERLEEQRGNGTLMRPDRAPVRTDGKTDSSTDSTSGNAPSVSDTGSSQSEDSSTASSGDENSTDAAGSSSSAATSENEESSTSEKETGDADQNTTPGTAPSISADDMQNMTFVYNSYSIAYDLKLLLMLLCILVPVAALANYYAKVRIGSPVGTLAGYMRGYTKELGNPENPYIGRIHDLGIHTGDEIEDLYTSVDTTVRAMEEYLERLKREQKLENDLAVAKAASEAKSSFLSNMSHEIRTPINAVLGMDEMILRESDEPETLEYASNIQNAGRTLLSLVNDILDFSKIEAGKMQILPVEYDLSSTINDLVMLVKERAEKKGLALVLQISPDIPHLLYGDEIRVKQCVTNILTNAVKYTEQGSVTLAVSSRKATDADIRTTPAELKQYDALPGRKNGEYIFLQFRVTDTGIGMKEEDLSKLFSPFERIEEIRNRSIEGTGLGMSITKKLLAMMQTKMNVRSVYGKGSDFSFEVLQRVVDPEPIGDYSARYHELSRQKKAYHALFSAPAAEILITDDNRMNLMVAAGLLKATHVRVDTAMSGQETLDKTRGKKYDIIFLDHLMPEMDGIETLRRLKSDLDNPNSTGTPVIALTANAVSGAREEYIRAGFDDYLTKPVDGPKMERLILNLLPPEKVEEASEGSEKVEQASEGLEKKDGTVPESGRIEEADSAWLSAFRQISGIDAGEALTNCGTEDILREAVGEFRMTIGDKADEIERFAAAGDIRDYTIRVHALKSSARLIGATALSELAKRLEAAGNAEDTAEIGKDTPVLLSMYRAFEAALRPVTEDDSSGGSIGDSPVEGQDGRGSDSSDDTGHDAAADMRPLLPAEELRNAYSDMRELISAFDFDSADAIVSMLKASRLPAGEEERFHEIQVLLKNVDHDGLLRILSPGGQGKN